MIEGVRHHELPKQLMLTPLIHATLLGSNLLSLAAWCHLPSPDILHMQQQP